jgi:membrane-bound serine protease (ClpP class)
MEDFPLTKYLVLLIGGILLLGLETILPGGVVGFIGCLALVGAAVVGFALPEPWGMVNMAGILVLAILTVAIWIRYFPRSVVGRMLTLQQDTKSYKSANALTELVGLEGVAQSTLRPAGIARINGKRVDVTAEGSWIEAGSPVKVVRVEGNHVTVREIRAA